MATLYTLLLTLGGSQPGRAAGSAPRRRRCCGCSCSAPRSSFASRPASIACRITAGRAVSGDRDARGCAAASPTKFAESPGINARLVGRVPLDADTDRGEGEVLAPSIEHLEWIVVRARHPPRAASRHTDRTPSAMLEVDPRGEGARRAGVRPAADARGDRLQRASSTISTGSRSWACRASGSAGPRASIKRALDLCGAMLLARRARSGAARDRRRRSSSARRVPCSSASAASAATASRSR